MKHWLVRSLLGLLVLVVSATAQNPSDSKSSLEKVLNSMDQAAAAFRSAQAAFEWDQFQKVVNETDIQKGTVYFRRQGQEVQMAADISEPDKKYVLFSQGKVRVYQPRIEQVTEYDAGKNKAEFESFLVLGFGGSGHDLLKSFDVQYMGSEQAMGVEAAKLQLIPKSQRVHGMFDHILLWIDPTRGVSVQQQFFEPSGDYRLAKYNDIRLNQRISDDVFKLKTTGKTRYVRPQG